jgi:regulatory protein
MTDVETARQLCLELLAAAPRTRAQLASALRRRGVPAEVAGQLLARLTDVGLIDDAAFAAAWVESRHYSRGLSRRALAAELRQRGVDEGQVRDAVATLSTEREAVTARQLVNARLAATHGQPPRARTRRLAAMLARKGYPAEMVFRVIREALEQEGIDMAAAGVGDAGVDVGAGEPWQDVAADE